MLKLLSDLVDCGSDLNNCLSDQYAKSVTLTNRSEQKLQWDRRFRKRINYVNELEAKIYFMQKVINFPAFLSKKLPRLEDCSSPTQRRRGGIGINHNTIYGSVTKNEIESAMNMHAMNTYLFSKK